MKEEEESNPQLDTTSRKISATHTLKAVVIEGMAIAFEAIPKITD